MQTPRGFRASVKGIKLASAAKKKAEPKSKAAPKKKAAGKKSVKVSKTQLAKEKALDRKFS